MSHNIFLQKISFVLKFTMQVCNYVITSLGICVEKKKKSMYSTLTLTNYHYWQW